MDSSPFSWISEMDSSSAPILLSFGNDKEEAAVFKVLKSQVTPLIVDKQSKTINKKGSRIRLPSQAYDHIIAERKRREQLSQRFIALSTIVPGLKKIYKTSVLGDSIKYLKHLQERVKLLEEQQKRQTMESVVLVKKAQILGDDEEGSSDEDECGSSDVEHPLPEIEARACNNHILLRVHCERQRGILFNLLSKVESLNLTVINSNVTPFGTSAIDITIIAEMEKEFNLTVKDVVRRLRAALRDIE